MAISIGSVLQQNQSSAASQRASALTQAEAPPKPTKVVTLTENGARQALAMMAKEGHDPATTWLRLGVKGGGCSGLAYLIDFSRKKDVIDVEFEFHGVKVLVDRKSLLYLGGTQLDWVTGLKGHGWQFGNPNQKKGCSCGESFSI